MKKLLVFLVLLFNFYHHAYGFTPCRIGGYSYAIECTTLVVESPVSHKSLFDVTVYKVPARVRYPMPSPLVWIPDSLSLSPSVRAPFMINSLSRLRNKRDFIWIALTPHTPLLRTDCGWTQPWTSVSMRLNRFSYPEYLAHCQTQLKKLGALDELSPETLAAYYEAVATQLNLPKVTIFAEQAGARIASAWHQQAPGRILFQVVDNPLSAYRQTALMHRAVAIDHRLENISTQCRLSGQCAAEDTGLNAQFNRLREHLPKQITVQNPFTFAEESITFTAPFLAFAIQQQLNMPEQAQWLPTVIQHANQGDWLPMYQLFAGQWTRRAPKIHDVFYLAEQCIEWQNFNTSSIGQNVHQPLLANWFHQQLKQRYQSLCQPGVRLLHLPIKPKLPPPPQLILQGQQLLDDVDDPGAESTLLLNVPGVGVNVFAYGCAKELIARYFKLQDKRSDADRPATIRPADIEADCLLNIPLPVRPTRSAYLQKP